MCVVYEIKMRIHNFVLSSSFFLNYHDSITNRHLLWTPITQKHLLFKMRIQYAYRYCPILIVGCIKYTREALQRNLMYDLLFDKILWMNHPIRLYFCFGLSETKKNIVFIIVVEKWERRLVSYWKIFWTLLSTSLC